MPLSSTDCIPVFSPHIGLDTVKAVTDALHVGWIGMGATTLEFENALRTYLHTDRHVVATMTGTASLQLALQLAGVAAGDEVILPSFNFIADVQAILWCGGSPVFCDIDAQTLSMDPACIEELITPRTRAIMPLHFAGMVGDLDALYAIAHRHGLRVIEDATHALGSTHNGRRIGSFGDITCFSFDPVKIITCLDGGAVVCSREEDISRLHRWRLLGIDRDTAERYRNRRAWDYDVLDVGYRCHMTNINAAIGLSQLARLDEFICNRRSVCRAYNDAFAECAGVEIHDWDYDTIGPFIYTLKVLDHQRDRFMNHLRASGVDTGLHFLPCHSKSLCRNMTRGPMHVTNTVSSQIVTLPLWSSMPSTIVERVIHAVKSFRPAEAVVQT